MGAKRAAGAAAGAALALLAVPGFAQVPSRAEIVEHGEYVVDRDVGTLGPKFRPSGTAGVVTSNGFRFVSRTSVIEARLCHRFGIAFLVPELDPVFTTRVTIRVRHPPLVRPGQAPEEEASWESPVNGREPGFAGYIFGARWEMVPGTWTFSVLHGGRTLAEQAFQVVTPADPGEASPASCTDPIS